MASFVYRGKRDPYSVCRFTEFRRSNLGAWLSPILSARYFLRKIDQNNLNTCEIFGKLQFLFRVIEISVNALHKNKPPAHLFEQGERLSTPVGILFSFWP